MFWTCFLPYLPLQQNVIKPRFLFNVCLFQNFLFILFLNCTFFLKNHFVNEREKTIKNQRNFKFNIFYFTAYITDTHTMNLIPFFRGKFTVLFNYTLFRKQHQFYGEQRVFSNFSKLSNIFTLLLSLLYQPFEFSRFCDGAFSSVWMISTRSWRI